MRGSHLVSRRATQGSASSRRRRKWRTWADRSRRPVRRPAGSRGAQNEGRDPRGALARTRGAESTSRDQKSHREQGDGQAGREFRPESQAERNAFHPIEQRGFLEPGLAPKARRDPIAGAGHLTGDGCVARFVRPHQAGGAEVEEIQHPDQGQEQPHGARRFSGAFLSLYLADTISSLPPCYSPLKLNCNGLVCFLGGRKDGAEINQNPELPHVAGCQSHQCPEFSLSWWGRTEPESRRCLMCLVFYEIPYLETCGKHWMLVAASPKLSQEGTKLDASWWRSRSRCPLPMCRGL